MPDTERYSESDTRAKLITPALRSCGWGEELIRREVSADETVATETTGRIVPSETAGEIIKTHNSARRGNKQADYLLSIQPDNGGRLIPVALLEAKKNTDSPGRGMEQAKNYARRCDLFNVPFIYSSNGYQFVEYDSLAGKESAPKDMSHFPAPSMLKARYEEYNQFSLSEDVAAPLAAAESAGNTGTRRYYQDAAIRAVLERIAHQEKHGEPRRALLSLATGAGKTFIAVDLLKQLDEGGKLRRALFLCDRDILRRQALAQFQAAFGNDAEIVKRDNDGFNFARNARVHIATYQMLGIEGGDTGETFAAENYSLNEFSHIIIDECHRSVRNDWAKILSDNEDGVHIGLTATPRQIKESDDERKERAREISSHNMAYFGEPVYVYDAAQGAKDGYIALCEIRKSNVNIDETGLTLDEIMRLGPTDHRTGRPLSEEELKKLYESTDYEDILMLPDRVHRMCADLFKHLVAATVAGGAAQKTIIFCVRREHAQMVAREMNNLYARHCDETGKSRADPYAFVCMSNEGADNLPDFRAEDDHHFIAASVDLLATGVDIPAVRNIVFFNYLKSPIVVRQMMGRGSRIDEARDKLMFTVHDYTNATDLLEDDEWTPPPPGGGGGGGGGEAPIIAQVDGLDIVVEDGGYYVMHTDDNDRERRIGVEEYRRLLAERVSQRVKSVDDLREIWINPEERKELMRQLRDAGVSVSALAQLLNIAQDNYDGYDIIANNVYAAAAVTQNDRAETFADKNAEWLESLSPGVAGVVRAFVRQFARGGIETLEDPAIFDTPDLKAAGGMGALGEASNDDILVDIKRRLFAA